MNGGRLCWSKGAYGFAPLVGVALSVLVITAFVGVNGGSSIFCANL